MRKNQERFSDPTGMTFTDEDGKVWEIKEDGTLQEKDVGVKPTDDNRT